MLVTLIILLILFKVCCMIFLHKETDDVHPRIMSIRNPYAQDSKWLWVIPLYMDDPISNHPKWVKELLKSGKKIGLHGVKHTHKEFETDLSDEYIDSGIEEFQKAFGYYPTHFKAPSLVLTYNNRKKLEKRGLKIKGRINQFLHTCYHSPTHRQADGRLIGEFFNTKDYQ